jgi:hypothetical protein
MRRTYLLVLAFLRFSLKSETGITIKTINLISLSFFLLQDELFLVVLVKTNYLAGYIKYENFWVDLSI